MQNKSVEFRFSNFNEMKNLNIDGGDYLGAGLIFAAMIPLAGDALAKSGKFIRATVKSSAEVLAGVRALVKHGDEGVDAVKVLAKNADDVVIAGAKRPVQYTKNSLKMGRDVHKLYKADVHDPAKGLYKEFTKVKGVRPDFVDFNTRTIYELKPYNPANIKLGTKQLNNYKKVFEQYYDGTWNTVLDFY